MTSCALRANEPGYLLVVPDDDKDEVSFVDDEQDAQLKPCSEFKVVTQRSYSDAGMLVRMTESFL